MAKNDVGVVTTQEALSPSDRYALEKVVKRARVRAGVSEQKKKCTTCTLFLEND